MKTTFYIVRHGQSIGNLRLMFLGHTDMDLSDLGRQQAEVTCKRLRDVDFALIASSDLTRAYNTALPHAEARGVGVYTDKRFRELYCGDWEGMFVEDIKAKYGALYTDEWVHGFGEFVMPSGEAMADCVLRMTEASTELAQAYPDSNILVASHGGTIRGFYASVLGISPAEVGDKLGWATNASYSIVEYDGEKFIPVAYSVDDHLEGMTSEWRD